MSAGFKLPPSERDFDLFFKVMFHSVSSREAARFFNISPTRVRQLVALVGDWVAEHLPEVGEADLARQVSLAQQVAANRLEHQYEQTMALWKAESNPRHLRQATRIALAQARLGLVPGRLHALAADVTAGPLELGDEIAPVEAHSPDRDCAPTAGQEAGDPPTDADEIAASDCPEQMVERERYQRLRSVEGYSLMENRLLSLIANQGSHNPEKVAELAETLSRVRAEKATAELRLSRYAPGVQIAALDVPQEAAALQ